MIDELIKIFKDWQTDYTKVPDEWAFDDDALYDLEYIDEVDLGQGRWSTCILSVFEYKTKLFGVEWERGLTEYQENGFDPNKSTVYPVERREKIVYTYDKVAGDLGHDDSVHDSDWPQNLMMD